MSVHEDTLLGLQQALDYFKGDKSKARSMIVEIPDDEVEFNQVLFYKVGGLSKLDKQRTMEFVDDLAMAANE